MNNYISFIDDEGKIRRVNREAITDICEYVRTMNTIGKNGSEEPTITEKYTVEIYVTGKPLPIVFNTYNADDHKSFIHAVLDIPMPVAPETVDAAAAQQEAVVE